MNSTADIACVTLALLAAGNAAFAQSNVPPPAKAEVPLSDEQARFLQCMKDWDATTHMTKKEWERTCRRVTNERVKYLREEGYVPGGEKGQPRPNRLAR